MKENVVVDLYRRMLWQSLPSIEDIHMRPCSAEAVGAGRRELETRMAGDDAFDSGRTMEWLRGLAASGRAEWYSFTDAVTGHTVHAVSERGAAAVTPVLREALRLLRWMSRTTPITWYWWDQPWMRYLPAGVRPGRDHINGGWAVPGTPEVHVYRREEALKVMLHEVIHGLGLDVAAAAVAEPRAQFERALGRKLWPHLGEAYTELFAEWLWSIAAARSLADARRRWRAQRACAERQAAQVWARTRDSREAEDTNVFAYYVLKWVLMLHEDMVLLHPDKSVQHWYQWWTEAWPAFEAVVRVPGVVASLSTDVALGMTCSGSDS